MDKNDENGKRRLFTPIKANVCIEPTSLAFQIIDGKIVFEGDPFKMAADEALSEEESEKRTAVTEAKEWLIGELENGEVRATKILRNAKKMNIGERTLRKAKQILGVRSFRQDFGAGGEWYWKLKDEEIPI